MKRTSYEVSRLVNYTRGASVEDLMEDYGIEILEDGKVFDVVEDITFSSVLDWAESVVGEEEDDSWSRSTNKRGRLEDDDMYY